jgi:hypothetical protein
MAEYNIMVMDRMIEYTGLFDLPGLIKLLDMWFKERGYDKRETKNYEEVYENHRQVTIEMLPYKKISDNVKFEMRLFMIFKNLQETEVEKEGKKVRLMKGTAQIFMDAYMNTDYEHKWDKTPMYFFFRIMFDRYVYKNYIHRARNEFMSDVAKVEEEIKSYLNLFRYR